MRFCALPKGPSARSAWSEIQTGNSLVTKRFLNNRTTRAKLNIFAQCIKENVSKENKVKLIIVLMYLFLHHKSNRDKHPIVPTNNASKYFSHGEHVTNLLNTAVNIYL